jgi:hypothetical protein
MKPIDATKLLKIQNLQYIIHENQNRATKSIIDRSSSQLFQVGMSMTSNPA